MKRWNQGPVQPQSESKNQSPILPDPPPAPEKREAPPKAEAEATKEAKAQQANEEDNPVLKPHVLRETEVRPIHRFIGRITKRLGMPLEPDEQAALDEHGARFWARWIRTSWGASAFAYGGTWAEIVVSRAVERAIEEKQRAKERAANGAHEGAKEATAPIDSEAKANAPRNGATKAPEVAVDDKLADMGSATYKD